MANGRALGVAGKCGSSYYTSVCISNRGQLPTHRLCAACLLLKIRLKWVAVTFRFIGIHSVTKKEAAGKGLPEQTTRAGIYPALQTTAPLVEFWH